MNCDFFVTDSFHGTCFAIIMGKPFISILNNKRGGSRFPSLLELFGLDERLIETSKDLEERSNLLTEDIDYEKVYEILEKEKKRCLTWLRTNLRKAKKNVYSDYDMMQKLLRDQQKTIEGLKKEIIGLSKLLGKEGRYIENLEEYLDYLYRRRMDYTILIAVKDTPGLALNQKIAEKLNRLGIQNIMWGKHGHSFAAVIDGGNNIYEELGNGDAPINTSINLGENQVTLISRVFKNGNEAVIKWNHRNYAVNLRGLNFVLVSKKTGIVEDAVCFDTHVQEYICNRNLEEL